jgi:hypothetical protein
MENGRETGGENILNNLRRDDLTRTTPSRESVEDNDGLQLERFGELFLAVQSTTLALISIPNQTRGNIPVNVVDTHFACGTLKSS